jgi:glycosyltransferase involved in cell wall biosynthesis
MQPHILVIVPAWNTANFLQATLQSVVEQTFREFEVILVDDERWPRAVGQNFRFSK